MVDAKISNSLWARNALVSRTPRDPPQLSWKRLRGKPPAETSRPQEARRRLTPQSRWAPLAHLCVHRPPLWAEPRATPSGIGHALTPGAGTRGRALLGIGRRGGRTGGRQSRIAGAAAGRGAGPCARVACQPLAPRGFLGDVAPPPAQPPSGRAGDAAESLLIQRREVRRTPAGRSAGGCVCALQGCEGGSTGRDVGTRAPLPGTAGPSKASLGPGSKSGRLWGGRPRRGQASRPSRGGSGLEDAARGKPDTHPTLSRRQAWEMPRTRRPPSQGKRKRR